MPNIIVFSQQASNKRQVLPSIQQSYPAYGAPN